MKFRSIHDSMKNRVEDLFFAEYRSALDSDDDIRDLGGCDDTDASTPWGYPPLYDIPHRDDGIDFDNHLDLLCLSSESEDKVRTERVSSWEEDIVKAAKAAFAGNKAEIIKLLKEDIQNRIDNE